MGNEEGATMEVRAVMRGVISKGEDRLRVYGVVKVNTKRWVSVSQCA